MHWHFTNADQTVTVNLSENSSNGAVWGTITYQGSDYPVSGMWQASYGGGIAARKTSNLQLSGQFDGTSIPDFIALSGLIRGTAPNMTEMNVTLNMASTGSGEVNQVSADLAPNPAAVNPPSQQNPPPSGSPDIPWKLSSADGSVTMDVLVGGNGEVSGTLTAGNSFAISGRWAAAGSPAGRVASAFQVTGHYAVAQNAWDLIAAAGTMTGLAHFPQKVELSASRASISEWTNEAFTANLLPTSQTDPNALAAAYAESYMVIQMGGTHGDSQAVAGWQGPADSAGNISPFGTGNYQSTGRSLTAAELAAIVDPASSDPIKIRVPSFSSEATARPVMIQFIGEAGHFKQPPLAEYHEKITKIFYDEQAGALVLQFTDIPGQPTSQINFNQGRAKNHMSVIIEPE